MRLVEGIFLWVGANFSTEVYMLSTKIQGILWSMADIALVYLLLKIATLVRAKKQKKKIIFRYFFLWFSALLTPLLIFTDESEQFFLLESIIFATQYAILLYTLIVERKGMIDVVKEVVAENKP